MSLCTDDTFTPVPWIPHDLPIDLCHTKVKDTRWMSSHRTYLARGQIGCRTARPSQYSKALRQGYRMLDIDIHEKDGRLLVGNGCWTNSFLLEDALNIIHNEAFANTNYPLAISIKSSVKSQSGKNCIVYLFRTTFKDRLCYPMTAQAMAETHLGFFRNKILIFSWGVYDLHDITTVNFGAYGILNQTKLPAYSSTNWEILENRVRRQMMLIPPNNCLRNTNLDPTVVNIGAQWVCVNVQNPDSRLYAINRPFYDNGTPIVAQASEE